MNSCSLYLLFVFGILLTSPSLATYTPTDKIFLCCGICGSEVDLEGRIWICDSESKYLSSTPSQSYESWQNASVPYTPFSSARVFTSNYTYTFPISPGRHFIRLYFYPTNYSTHFPEDSYFSLTAGPYTLLSNFSALLASLNNKVDYLVPEFSIELNSSMLNLTFSPSNTHANSFAFVNGIEIVSSPNIFNESNPLFINGGNGGNRLNQSMAVQTMYRLNVGGGIITRSEDSGLYRQWDHDSNYLNGMATGVTFAKDANVTISYPSTIPEYIAPDILYVTARSMGTHAQINLNYNLTWILSVDAGFYYLVRFHFCEIQYRITKPNQRVFDIFINNQTAQRQFDVIAFETNGGIGVPIYMDYVVITTGLGQMDMWIALHPDLATKTEYYDVILNGLEIFKIGNTENKNLAGLNPNPLTKNTINPTNVSNKSHGSMPKVAKVFGAAIGGIFVMFISLWTLITQFRISNRHSAGLITSGKGSTNNLSPPSNFCRNFSFVEILNATNGFDESLLLGFGGFGKVYYGRIDNGAIKVAIKRGNLLSEQGVHEFQTEIKLLSKLRHCHLVSLIGYCEEKNEMILVYDHMAHGTLREHLYKTKNTPLTWKQRLEICIGAAKGIHYLHTGAKHMIIHRDVKTTNILLDDKWVAKVADFGLSKMGPGLNNTHVSTAVKGSFGYLDPEYFRRQQLTEKSDVYSFGVVLFEVLCARPALDTNLPEEEISLAEWGRYCQRKGVLGEIIDPYLKGKIEPECFKIFAETAEKCVADEAIHRPSIGGVLWNLKFALQLQESAEEYGTIGVITSETANVCANTKTTSVSMGGRSINSVDSDGLVPGAAVFSEIVNPKGR